MVEIAEVYKKLEEILAVAVSNGMKTLIEEKHLYQNYTIAFPECEKVLDEIQASLGKIYDKDLINDIRNGCDEYKDVKWRPILPQRLGSLPFYISADNGFAIHFSPPTIKTYCSNCKGVQPYNFENGGDALENLSDQDFSQVLIFVYRCQSCKSCPEVFVVKRDSMRVQLCGRAPIEEVPVQSYLPKNQHRYFRDSMIAYNSGQVLAGIFLLRVFIEQYVQSLNLLPESIVGKNEVYELFGKYAKTLPDDFINRFPSLYAIYGDLSDAIHEAKENEAIFTKAKSDIEKHFEAKKLFDLKL